METFTQPNTYDDPKLQLTGATINEFYKNF